MVRETVVITGAGSGLGASLARKFSGIGYHVCLLGRTKATLMQTAESLHNECSIYEVDVTSKASVRDAITKIHRSRGSIEYLVNNAGVGYFKLVEDLAEEEIDQMIDTNLKGPIYCIQEVLEDMKKRNKGCIVNIVSGSGKVAKETESAYSASKFGLRGFLEAVSLEVKDFNIQLTSAYMGNMKTNLWEKDHPETKMSTYMEPDDVAEIIIENLKPRKNLHVTDITIMNHV